jgi:hypothetical protein
MMETTDGNGGAVSTRRGHAHARAVVAAALAAQCAWLPAARAIEIGTGASDVKLRWDNTLKYSAAARLKDPSAALVDNPPASINQDDGDRNFGKGRISNRVDLLSELDASYQSVGLRLSGAAWYDSVYHGANDNASPFTANSTSVAGDRFTRATRNLHGQKAELLDAFVYGRARLGDTNATVRLGKHTLLWGESLFFGDNGIAGGQAPTDVIKLLSVPNTQFKELIRPTNQVSGQLQLSPTVAIGAYYQFEWERSRLPAAGSYFGRADFLDAGGERLVAGAPDAPFNQPPAFMRGEDQQARSGGQGGAQLRWRSEALDTDFGFYAIRFHDKSPGVYFRPSAGAPNFATGRIGTYNLVYGEGIKAFGMSASKSIGAFNVAGEVSVRRNTPLVASGGAVVVAPGQLADNNDHPFYPVGNSAHAQVSLVHTLERNDWWEGGLLLGEVAWHRRTSITRNAGNIDPNATRDAAAARMIFSPTWYQALPGLDLSLPLGVGYNFGGRSSVISLWNGGWSRAGDLSVGLAGEYLLKWKGGISYTRYVGGAAPLVNGANNYSFRQSFKDRDFISVSIQTTF